MTDLDWMAQAADHPDRSLLAQKFRYKYFYDCLFAVLILLLTWPVFLGLALLIKLDGWIYPENAGPIIYGEPRISEGKTFNIFKFRTVTQKEIQRIQESPDSRSITGGETKTWAGKIILNWYLDEIPQLMNIARGEMSFVGLRPHIIDHTREEMEAGFPYRAILRAGLFGLPQACKRDPRYQSILERMARMHKPLRIILFKLDGLYVQKCKQMNPLQILFFDLYVAGRCFLVIFRGGGV